MAGSSGEVQLEVDGGVAVVTLNAPQRRNALSGLPLSLLDRSRDLVDAGVQHAPQRLAPAGEAVSRGLAAVAGWVERVPLARRGDRPPTSR